MDHIALLPHRHGKAAAPEDVQHGTIAGKHVGLQPVQALHPGDGDEMAYQQAADPAALVVLFDGEGQFGAASRGGDRAADEVARPADDDLLLTRADSYQQRELTA